jgi:hypothetical protein
VAVSFIGLSGHYYMFGLSLKKFLEGEVVGHKFEGGLPKANPSQVMTTAHVEFGYELKQVCQVTPKMDYRVRKNNFRSMLLVFQ